MKENKTISVYLVDDDLLYLRLLEFGLSQSPAGKFAIKSFTSGEECLAQMEASKPEVVVLDYYLDSLQKNALNGMKILQEIQKKSTDIQVIMLSKQEKLEIAVNCLKSGAYDYIVKNESAVLRLGHEINLIAQAKDIRLKMGIYLKWNIILGSLFLALGVVMAIYAWQHSD